MASFDIEIYDTREDKIGTIRNVPAETELEACEKVAIKQGYSWIGPAGDGLAGGYALNLNVYRDWHGSVVRDGQTVQLSESELQEELRRDTAAVKAGELDEFRGLYWLYEADQYLDADYAD